jgi:ferric iron reductase protein FhuF
VAPDGDGWVSADEIVYGGPVLDRALDRLATQASDAGHARAIGSQFVVRYLRFVWPAVAAFALERRVPDVASDNVLVRFDEDGWPSALALAQPRFAALPTDPCAAAAHVKVLDGRVLLGWLHERAVECHAGPLIEAVRGRLHTSSTALWGNVASAFALPLLWTIQPIAPDARAIARDALALFDQEIAPRLHDKIRLLTVAHGDAEWTVHARRTCCLSWCLPDGSRCEDCPLAHEPVATDLMSRRVANAVARGRQLRGDLRFEDLPSSDVHAQKD